MKDDEIKVKIAEVAKIEFQELGYVNASMRNISSKAGLTTGSVYNRFKDKAELFEYIVGSNVRSVFDKFVAFNEVFSHSSAEDMQTTLEVYENSALKFLIDNMFENYDSFDLVINKGAGSPYEGFMDSMVQIATKNTMSYILNRGVEGADPAVIKDVTDLINTALFNAISEIFRHKYNKEQANQYIYFLFKFYNGGWNNILQ